MALPGRKPSTKHQLRGLGVAALVSLLAFAADRCWQGREGGWGGRQAVAARLMQQALDAVREHRERNGPLIDLTVDPNRTGLIGVEYSEMTTTLGDLEAKRTTTNPAMASLLVDLLEDAGVGPGDQVAVGCSGSFPALLVATLSAVEALRAEPIVVVSLGASSYGANRLDFTLLELSDLLKRRGVLPHTIAGASLGGSGDRGLEFDPLVRSLLVEKIRSAGIPLLDSERLSDAVAERLALYGVDSWGTAVKAFVNIGGSAADMGGDPWILGLAPGLHRTIEVPEGLGEGGVLLTMAQRKIPVIHLLNIKGLARTHGIPWDPVPLTERTRGASGAVLAVILSLYLIGLGVVFYLSKRHLLWTTRTGRSL